MSGPLIFFMIVLVGDLVLKTLRDKKKIERSKEEKQINVGKNIDYNKNQQREAKKEPGTIRGMMEVLREEIDKKQNKPEKTKETKFYSENQERVKKEYEDNKYWEKKEKEKTYNDNKKANIKLENDKKEDDIRKELIRGIIFSEIISEPKAIKNQKRNI